MEIRREHIFERLLRLPLFQGLSREELTAIAGHTPLAFTHHEAGTTLHNEGDVCDEMTFVIEGQLTAISQADDHSYRVEEQLYAPTLLAPEYLFGLTQHYPQCYVTTTRCDLLVIGKSEVQVLMEGYAIFRASLLNIIATRAQRMARRPWRPQPSTTRQKICRFLADHCLYPAGDKVFHIGMQQLATAVGESRLNVSKQLHVMHDEHLISISRERIHIPAMEKMFEANRNN